MRPAPIHRSLATLALCAAAAFGTAAIAKDKDTIFLCEDERGNTVYQTVPCPEVAAPEPEPAPVPVAPKRTTKAKPQPQRSAPPARAARPQPTVQRSSETWAVVPRTPDKGRARRARFGKQHFPIRIGDGLPSEPRFDSPQNTWSTFLAALEAHDADSAAACLTPSARADHAREVEPFPVEKMRRLVRSFARIEDKGDLGVYWSASGVRPDRRPKWILFEETARGVWKIAGI